MPKVLVVGGGYAGFYTAWGLSKLLDPGEARGVRPGVSAAGRARATPSTDRDLRRRRVHGRGGLRRAPVTGYFGAEVDANLLIPTPGAGAWIAPTTYDTWLRGRV